MNDVTSMLYVSPVRQFETPLFYAVTSRIEALVVSCHKFLNACVEKVYRLLLQPIVYCRFHLCSFRKCRFSVTIRCSFPWHIREKFGQIRDGEASVFADFHLNLLYEIGSHDAVATAAFVVVHVISTTFKLPTPSSNHTVTHRSHTCLWISAGWIFLACRNRMTARISQSAGFSMRFAIFQQLQLATAIKAWRTPSGMFVK